MNTHIHHIIPKHMGGTNDPSNLIELTIEEHAEAHKLLWEQHGHWQDYLAWKALSGQIDTNELRILLTQLTWTGRKHKPETIQKIKEARAKQIITEEHKKNTSLALKGKIATPNAYSPEARKKNSEAQKRQPRPNITCPHCNKSGGTIVMKRWHFDNCTSLNSHSQY